MCVVLAIDTAVKQLPPSHSSMTMHGMRGEEEDEEVGETMRMRCQILMLALRDSACPEKIGRGADKKGME